MTADSSAVFYRPEVWLAARVLIDKFGSDAMIWASEHLREKQGQMDDDAVGFWMDVMTAILEWQRSKPRLDETLH